MKNIFLAILLILPFLSISPTAGNNDGIIRLHVIANSDSEYDQNMKLYVRDALLGASEDIPHEEIKNRLDFMEEVAQAAVYSYGSDLPVSVKFGIFSFPTKSYGNVTLPAGKYTAVRVIIGEGNGKNWWCVMYPPLCFTDQTTAHFDEDFITKNGLTKSGRPKFEIKFKLAELFT